VKYDPPLKIPTLFVAFYFSVCPIIVIEQNISPTKNRLFSLLLLFEPKLQGFYLFIVLKEVAFKTTTIDPY
jgi:hypothetical protein